MTITFNGKETTIAKAISEIKDKLANNDVWLIRGLLAIYAGQTEVEQNCETTVEDNGIGFNGCDANILSSFAKQVERGLAQERKIEWTLSVKQKALARKKMSKYARQLLNISLAKASV